MDSLPDGAYWTYTMFYFPGLLLASASMAAYIGGDKTAYLHDSKPFLLVVCLALLAVAVILNIIRAQYRQVAAERGRAASGRTSR